MQNLFFQNWGTIDYETALERREALLREKIEQKKRGEDPLQEIIFCSHPTDDSTSYSAEQIVGYPILDLEQLGIDLRQYMWVLEECIILTLAEDGIIAGRLDGAAGVWLDADKPTARQICTIKVGTSEGVTEHGFVLNVTLMQKELSEAVDTDVVICQLESRFVDLLCKQI